MRNKLSETFMVGALQTQGSGSGGVMPTVCSGKYMLESNGRRLNLYIKLQVGGAFIGICKYINPEIDYAITWL